MAMLKHPNVYSPVSAERVSTACLINDTDYQQLEYNQKVAQPSKNKNTKKSKYQKHIMTVFELFLELEY